MPDVTLLHGCSLELLRMWPSNSVDSVVTDPPYALVSIVKRFGGEGAAPAKGDVYARASAGFMGQQWDTGEVAFAVEFWSEVMRVLKPGGHVLAFSGSRTYHRLAVAIEDAGFEIRDQIMWLYGSGFPKSHDVSKGIDKAAGVERDVVGTVRAGIGRVSRNGGELVGGVCDEGAKRVAVATPATDAAKQWEGWGTALKPAHEPIVMARKPLVGTVAANVLAHGTGAINVDGCRVGDEPMQATASNGVLISENGSMAGGNYGRVAAGTKTGRWPANIIHDGSDEVVAAFPNSKSGVESAPRGTGGDMVWRKQ